MCVSRVCPRPLCCYTLLCSEFPSCLALINSGSPRVDANLVLCLPPVLPSHPPLCVMRVFISLFQPPIWFNFPLLSPNTKGINHPCFFSTNCKQGQMKSVTRCIFFYARHSVCLLHDYLHNYRYAIRLFVNASFLCKSWVSFGLSFAHRLVMGALLRPWSQVIVLF